MAEGSSDLNDGLVIDGGGERMRFVEKVTIPSGQYAVEVIYMKSPGSLRPLASEILVHRKTGEEWIKVGGELGVDLGEEGDVGENMEEVAGQVTKLLKNGTRPEDLDLVWNEVTLGGDLG